MAAMNLFLIFFGICMISPPSEALPTPVPSVNCPYSIVLAFDGSNVTAAEWASLKSWAGNLVAYLARRTPIGQNGLQFSLAVFGNQTQIPFIWNNSTSTSAVLSGIQNLPAPPNDGVRNTAGAISTISNDILILHKGGFRNWFQHPALVILVTNGGHTNGTKSPIRPAHVLAYYQNIFTLSVGVGVQSQQDYKELFAISSNRSSDVFNATSYTSLNTVTPSLLNLMSNCSCPNNPCQNKQPCVGSAGHAFCNCNPDYWGHHCETVYICNMTISNRGAYILRAAISVGYDFVTEYLYTGRDLHWNAVRGDVVIMTPVWGTREPQVCEITSDHCAHGRQHIRCSGTTFYGFRCQCY